MPIVKKTAVLVGAACALVLALSPAAQAAPDDNRAQTLTALKTFQAAAGPGAGVYAGDSTGSYSLSVGTGTINTNTPITPTDRFRVGSQTKTFTAATVLTLVGEGKVSLDTVIGQYLPGVVTGNGYDGNAITVRQLLQHTSGIAAYSPNPLLPPPANPDGSFSLDVLVRDGLKNAPVGQPGATMVYSNTNYLILGMLIEKVTGTPVHEAVMARIVRPLGLTATSFPAPGDRSLPTPAVHGYNGVRFAGFFFWRDVISYDPSLFSSTGAMISTQDDLTRFYQALISGRVIPPAILTEMERTVPVGSPDSLLAYGLGIARYSLPCGGVAWGHDGEVPGYYTETLVTEDGRHASVVTNAHLATNPPVGQMYGVLNAALCDKS
ncbi:serine hydrolase domain-containing protein [Kitasatospora sp. NPDC056783]|uniref:serine hydrolase domain-containing protein n=1 Tax=Kitasatospora sp. NPDC056783 TaxID=3345943 RepID=UPI0036A501EA